MVVPGPLYFFVSSGSLFLLRQLDGKIWDWEYGAQPGTHHLGKMSRVYPVLSLAQTKKNYVNATNYK